MIIINEDIANYIADCITNDCLNYTRKNEIDSDLSIAMNNIAKLNTKIASIINIEELKVLKTNIKRLQETINNQLDDKIKIINEQLQTRK